MARLIWSSKPARNLTSSEPDTPPPNRQAILTTQHSYQPDETQAPTDIPALSWSNRLIHGDAHTILPALAHDFAGAVNLIYIDPPFMTGRIFHTTRDTVQVAYHDTWNNDLDTYLHWLYQTFQLLYTLLAPTGSLYVHLDWRATHYAKVLLDEIFGMNLNSLGPGFKNEIIWHYQSGGRARKHFARKHDSILLYTKSARYCFHSDRVGKPRGPHKRNHMRKEVDASGRVSWTIRSNGRIYRYAEDSLIAPSDVWSDISHLHQKDPERNGYATQKPASLLERILLTSSNEDDLVLDCFCGSGVTPAVAERLKRRWLACDQSDVAITCTQQRLLSQARRYSFALQRVSLSE